MSNSPELLRVTRFATATLIALGSLSLAIHDAPETQEAQLDAIEITTTTTTVPETTTTLAPTTTTSTTIPERVVPQRASRSAVRPRPEIVQAPVTGDKAQWMADAGIAEGNYNYVDFIMTKESTWRPDAISPNKCIGLGQNCANKNGYYWLEDACPQWQVDPVCQLKRFEEYAVGKYKSWEGAYIHWQQHGSW